MRTRGGGGRGAEPGRPDVQPGRLEGEQSRFVTAMSWLGVSLVATTALLGPALSGALVRPAGVRPRLRWFPTDWTQPSAPLILAPLALYGLSAALIMGFLAWSLYLASGLGARREWETLHALGMVRRDYVRGRAVAAARRTAIIAGLMVVAAEIARAVWLAVGTRGLPSTGVTFDGWTVVLDVVAVTLATAAGAVSAWHAASLATSRNSGFSRPPRVAASPATTAAAEGLYSPARDSATEQFDATVARNRSRLFRALRVLGAVVLAGAFAYRAWDHFTFDRQDIRGVAPWPQPAAGSGAAVVSEFLTNVTLLVALAWLVVWLCTRALDGLGSWWRRSRVVTFAVAADGLSHRSTNRTVAVAAVAVVMGLTAHGVTSTEIDRERFDATVPLNPDYVLVAGSHSTGDMVPGGYAGDTIDDATVAALTSSPELDVIPAAIVYGDPIYSEESVGEVRTSEYTSELHWWQENWIVNDPTAWSTDQQQRWALVGFGGSVAVSGSGWVGWAPGNPGPNRTVIENSTIDYFNAQPLATQAVMDSRLIEPLLGEPPVNALLIYAKDARGLDANDRYNLVSDIVWSTLPEGAAYSNSFPGIDTGDLPQPALLSTSGRWLFGLGLLASVGLTAAFAAASARARRGELATLAALGASPRVARRSPSVEAGVTVLVASSVAAVVSVIVAAVRLQPLLWEAGAPFDAKVLAINLWWNIANAPWPMLALLIGIATFAAWLMGFVVGTAPAEKTPAEQVRDAIKEGAL